MFNSSVFVKCAQTLRPKPFLTL